jgi:hypothetical protein
MANNRNREIMKKNQNDVRQLEQLYNTGKIDNMLEKIEERKTELIEEMIKYRERHLIPKEWDNDGNITRYEVNVNPLVITNYFFKSITPITSQEPIYNAEKLGMVYDFYCELVAEVNDKIGYYPSSLTSFCKFAGLTLSSLRTYKNSQDYNMRVVVEKIYDQVGDENITMSQMGIVKERSTIFKMKSQNEMVEKEQPRINVNITDKPDMKKINERLKKYSSFANKKEK